MKKSYKVLFASMFFVTGMVNADDVPPPVYECTAIEVASYISGTTPHYGLPTNVPTESEYRKDFLEEKAKEGDAECLSILDKIPDDIDFTKLMEKLEKLKSTDFSSIIASLLKEITDKFDEITAGVMEELQKGICERMDSAYLTKMVTDAVTKKTGFDLGNIDASTKLLIQGELYDMYGADSKYFFDQDAITPDMKSRTSTKLRTLDDSFWGG
jgi:predicted HAD superfamily phosphohydrolase